MVKNDQGVSISKVKTGQMNRQMNSQMNGQMSGQMNENIAFFSNLFLFSKFLSLSL